MMYFLKPIGVVDEGQSLVEEITNIGKNVLEQL
jgi:hypothetical protein